jgi:hypothetical protein
MAVTSFRGPIRATSVESDGQIFISALDAFYTGTATMTATRTAGGDVFLRRTANDTAFVVTIPLDNVLKKIGTDPQVTLGKLSTDDTGAARVRGILCNSVDVVHGIRTADLTTATYDFHRTTFATGSAASVASTIGGTLSGTLNVGTFHATQLLVDRITCGTPFVIGGNTTLVQDYLELSIDPAATSGWDFYGVFVNCSYNLL